MTNTVISYPIPAYSNPTPQPLYYIPSRFVIANIALGTTTLVTTSFAHNYSIGQLIRLIIPQGYGTRQLNGTESYIIHIPSTTSFILDIDSQNDDVFIPIPSISTSANAQSLAIGDANSGAINQTPASTFINIAGSFTDISPSTSLSGSSYNQ
jgi:hypothetical protein